jgi:hypothetical protein
MPTIASHGRRGYRQGCRCDECRLAEREYQQELKQRKAGPDPDLGIEASNAGLAFLPGGRAPVEAVGPRVAAFRRALESLDSDKVPDLVAAAESLAEVLDNPKALSTRPAAAAKFADLMSQIRKTGDPKKSRLASVRSMTSAKTG